MQVQNLSQALSHIVDLGNTANEYVARNPFWELNKSNEKRMHTVLYVLLEAMRIIGIALQPIVPDSAAKILEQLGVQTSSFADAIKAGALQPGAQLGSSSVIFARLS
jgi:methionyl-tRNA synthetase